jgi:hypothetical protein
LGDPNRLVVAVLELNVFVPEGMALKVEADEVGSALKQTRKLAMVSQVDKMVGRE